MIATNNFIYKYNNTVVTLEEFNRLVLLNKSYVEVDKNSVFSSFAPKIPKHLKEYDLSEDYFKNLMNIYSGNIDFVDKNSVFSSFAPKMSKEQQEILHEICMDQLTKLFEKEWTSLNNFAYDKVVSFMPDGTHRHKGKEITDEEFQNLRDEYELEIAEKEIKTEENMHLDEALHEIERQELEKKKSCMEIIKEKQTKVYPFLRANLQLDESGAKGSFTYTMFKTVNEVTDYMEKQIKERQELSDKLAKEMYLKYETPLLKAVRLEKEKIAAKFKQEALNKLNLSNAVTKVSQGGYCKTEDLFNEIEERNQLDDAKRLLCNTYYSLTFDKIVEISNAKTKKDISRILLNIKKEEFEIAEKEIKTEDIKDDVITNINRGEKETMEYLNTQKVGKLTMQSFYEVVYTKPTSNWNKFEITFADKDLDKIKELSIGDIKEMFDNTVSAKTDKTEENMNRLIEDEIERQEFEAKAKHEYRGVLTTTGMFFVWYPHLTGEWEKDKIEYLDIYKNLVDMRKVYKEQQISAKKDKTEEQKGLSTRHKSQDGSAHAEVPKFEMTPIGTPVIDTRDCFPHQMRRGKIINYSAQKTEKQGIKETENKVDYNELDFNYIDAMVSRMSENTKYPKGNWKKEMDIKELALSAMRHARRILQPIKGDIETAEQHAVALGCNGMMIYFQNNLK